MVKYHSKTQEVRATIAGSDIAESNLTSSELDMVPKLLHLVTSARKHRHWTGVDISAGPQPEPQIVPSRVQTHPDRGLIDKLTSSKLIAFDREGKIILGDRKPHVGAIAILFDWVRSYDE